MPVLIHHKWYKKIRSRSETESRSERSNAARLRVLPDRADRPAFRSAVSTPAHAKTDVAAGRVRRAIHDGLPRRIPGELVCARPVVSNPSRPETQLLSCERLAVTGHVAPQRLDSAAGSAG